MRTRSLAVAVGLALGAALGWALAQRHIRDHRQDLFSRRPLRRLSALAHLAGDAGVGTARLLRDYLGWESHPLLRRRAERLLRRLEATLG
jgi:hypothetical protein